MTIAKNQTDQLDLSTIIIKKINLKETSRNIFDKYHDFHEKNFKELYANDSLPDRETHEKSMITGWPGYEDHYYFIFKDNLEEEIIATIYYTYIEKDQPDYEKNKQNSYFYIIVASEYRRQGLGTKLFQIVFERILKERNCKYAETDSYRASGKAFCEKLGAKIINIGAENRLQIKDIDWDLINSWITESQEKAPNVSIESYHVMPEEDIIELCKLETILEAEMPTLEDDDEEKWEDVYTPEKLRKFEKKLKEMGTIRYVLFTREKDGTISGMTETRYNPNDRSERVEQGLTGIKKEYRGRGLGKWLKAQMIIYVKEHYPKARYITTGNAEHNTPMMSINNRLGFKTTYEEKSYKFNIKETLAKLQKK